MPEISSHIYIPEDTIKVFVSNPNYINNAPIWTVATYRVQGIVRSTTTIKDQKTMENVLAELNEWGIEKREFLGDITLGYSYVPKEAK